MNAWGSEPQTEWMQSTLRLMADEARVSREGGETVITRLADTLVIQAIRAWIADPSKSRTNWTLASLAAEVGMSRSAFAERFTRLVGEPATHYAGRWQMQTALTWLKEDRLSLGDAASRLGYESEAAFSRAFKRVIGVSPGVARRRDKEFDS